MARWRIVFGSEQKEIVGSISAAYAVVRTLLIEAGLDPECICTLYAKHGYSGFYYWEEIDYESSAEIIKGIARIEQMFG